MFKKAFWTILISTQLLLFLAACEEITPANDAKIAVQDRIEREAGQLELGNTVLADCIASRCETLKIDSLRLEDYTVLNDLSHVKVLMASRTDFDDLADISGMRQLTELHISYTNVKDLSGLKNFPNLKLLHFEGIAVNLDISPIGELTELTELVIGGLSERDDLSFIKNLTMLESLILNWDSGLVQVDMLRGHPALRNVEIRGEMPVDQSALLDIQHLESILIMSFDNIDTEIQAELESRGVWEELRWVAVC